MALSYGRFLKILLGNLELVPVIVTAVSRLTSAPTALAKWDEGIHPLGQIVAGDVDEFLAPEAAALDEVHVTSLECELCERLNGQPTAAGVSAAAWDGSRLKKLFGALVTYLPLLLQLVGALK